MRKDLSGKAIVNPTFARVISVEEAVRFNQLYGANEVFISLPAERKLPYFSS